MVGDELTTEDITQEVFLRLYKNIGRIRNINSAKYWLFTTARNEVYQYYRNKKVRTDQFNTTDIAEIEIRDGSSLYENYEVKEFGKLIKDELEKLPVEQKEVFVLREYSELSYSEIAHLLDISEDLVKSRLYKTRQKLIKSLKKKVA